MKFIVNGNTLSNLLQSISGVLTSNSTIPILDHFLFQIEGSTLTIKASDLETALSVSTELQDVHIDQLSAIAIPSKILLDIIKTFSDVPLSFSIEDETFAIEIRSGEGKYKLSGQSGEDFPIMLMPENTIRTELPTSSFVNAISKTIVASSPDDHRPQMSGVYCEIFNTYISFVGTDAHKLARCRVHGINSETETSFILPRKSLTVLKNILTSQKEEMEIAMSYNDTNVFFSFEKYSMICRLVDGRYPNYEAAIPTENPNKLLIDRLTFLNAIHRVSLFANQSTHQIRLKISGAEVLISSEDMDLSNEAKERVPCSYEGTPLEIGFNAKYLLEMVSNIDTEMVSIELSVPSRAGLLLPVEETTDGKATTETNDLLTLVMPVTLN